MTAEESYAETMKATRNYVLEQIRSSVRNCRFEVAVWHSYVYKELEDELLADGYDISRKENQIVISWNKPKKALIRQTGSRAVTFD